MDAASNAPSGSHGEAGPPPGAHDGTGTQPVLALVEGADGRQVSGSHLPGPQGRTHGLRLARVEREAVFREARGEARPIVVVGDAEEEGGVVALVPQQPQRPAQNPESKATPAMLGVGADAGDAADGEDGGAHSHTPIHDPEARNGLALVKDFDLPASLDARDGRGVVSHDQRGSAGRVT